MPTVFDDSGTAYDAVQVTQPTSLNGRLVPVGWWILTDPFGRRSEVSPASFTTMFTPVQGAYQLGQPGGAASLDKSGLVIQHSNFEGVAYGTATLDKNGNLVQNAGLALLNGAGEVIEDPASKGQTNGLATLNGSGNLVQTGGLLLASSLGAASGVASLDANQHTVQPPVHGVRAKGVWFNGNGSNPLSSATLQDLYTFDSMHWTGTSSGPFTLTTSGGLLAVRVTFANISNYYTNLAYTIDASIVIDTQPAITIGKQGILATGGWLESWTMGYAVAVAAGSHAIHVRVANEGGASGTWTYASVYVEVEEVA